MRKSILWILAAAAVVWIFFRKPAMQWYAARQTGLQAIADAHTQNGYTTYNTQLYSPPFWKPVVQFFKAGSYVPTGGRSNGQSVDYSVQG